MNEDEFYEEWRNYRDAIKSLPIKERSNFEWLIRYQEIVMLRKRFCERLKELREKQKRLIQRVE